MADSIADFENMTKNELLDICKEIGITGAQKKKKQELIYEILEEKAQKQGLIFSTGILEILPDGYGFLRSRTYLPGMKDFVDISPVIFPVNLPGVCPVVPY